MQRELPEGVSRTAAGVGVMRALHYLIDSEPWVIDDPVSRVLFGAAARARMLDDFAAALGNERAHALRGHVLVRSAFAEDRLQRAVERGVRQCVILGAGFDTFAYRQPPWMDGVRVFEVDAPATQAEKRARLTAAGIAVPPNVVYAAIDFERTALADGLRDAGLDPGTPAFFSWLGVMMYLTRDAVDAVFRSVAALPPQSEIAFTFTQATDSSDALAQRVAAVGEPLRTTVDVANLDVMLRAFGFREVTILTAAQAARYLGERTDQLRLGPRESIAAAIV
jgi:methyltransferase (TIGR00027 family)